MSNERTGEKIASFREEADVEINAIVSELEVLSRDIRGKQDAEKEVASSEAARDNGNG